MSISPFPLRNMHSIFIHTSTPNRQIFFGSNIPGFYTYFHLSTLGLHFGSKNTGELSIVFEDLSRNSAFFLNRSEALIPPPLTCLSSSIPLILVPPSYHPINIGIPDIILPYWFSFNPSLHHHVNTPHSPFLCIVQNNPTKL